ncbi:helix-turn-helix domain-containing protein [Streptomyces bobili]|uniref:AraC-like ligand-binding domain-containing protein n=1 Tax=Streptomyces bobili TaxID=67280 RepID=UPI0036E0D591
MSPDSSIPEPGRQLSGTLYTTDSVPTHQRRTYWRAALSQTFAAVDIAVSDEVCSGTIRTSRLGHLQVATVEGEPLRARRTPQLIARGEDEYLVVKLLVRGAAIVEQDAREVHLHPGEIVFCDLARPMRMEFPHPFQTKSLVLPRRLLGLGESDLQRLTATPIRPDTTLGSLLSPVLTQLVDTAETYPSAIGEVLARHIVDLLTVLVGERLHQEVGDTSSAAQVLLPRIQVFIDRHLADPDLTPEVIARAHHISVRYLHRLFETEDVTVSRWIQRRRLQECRRELARREAAGRTIAGVARQWGFTSAAHFSRIFRAAYEMSPAEWRDSAARAPRTPPSPSGVSRVPEPVSALRPRRSHLPPARSGFHLAGEAGDTAA